MYGDLRLQLAMQLVPALTSIHFAQGGNTTTSFVLFQRLHSLLELYAITKIHEYRSHYLFILTSS